MDGWLPRWLLSRLIHALTLVCVLAVMGASVWAIPGLWDKRETAFATTGGFATFYGVIFAVIEAWRGRSAAEAASKAAREASRRTLKLFGVKNIAECQSRIHSTLTDLEDDGWASTAVLSRIIELYIAEFHAEYLVVDSSHRQNVAALQSHAAGASGQLSGSALKRLKNTLIAMLADITVAAGIKLSETEK